MDRFSKLVIAVAISLCCAFAYAGYAQLAPPLGWSAGNGLSSGAGGAFNFGNAANSAQLVNGTVRTNAALNVGGRAVSIPATMRFAANAPKVAAGLIFAHPGLRTAAAIAAWLGVGKLIWDEVEGVWRETAEPEGGSGRMWWTNWNPALKSSPEAACRSSTGPNSAWNYIFIGVVNGPSGPKDCKFRVERKDNPNIWAEDTAALYFKDVQTPAECPTGWTLTPAGCASPAVDQPKFEEILTKPGNIMPERVPLDLPHPLPINLPEIAPLFIPTGNPVPNPNYNPSAPPGANNQPWNQPGVRVSPAPVPGSPWQVDVQPIDRPVNNPNPNPEPIPDPNGNPDDKPSDKEPGLCDMYPEILACQKLDQPPDKDLQTSEKPISITPDSGWGAEDAGCPSPKIINVQGQQIAIPFDLFCTYMQGMRPIIIAMAWLSAAFILIGARESS